MSAGWRDFVKPALLGLAPYDPGPSIEELRVRHGLDEILKLNWNEGLLGSFPGALEAAAAELENAWMYPEQAYSDFRRALSEWLGVPPGQLVPAHGIQALVASLTAAAILPGDRVVIPVPTYGLYAQVMTAAGAEIVRVPATSNLRLDLDGMAAAARRVDAKLAVVCDPNNPTGSHVERGEWEAFLDALPDGCAVVADEAYVEYVDPDKQLRREQDVAAGRPVIVFRTFSKIFGLAGLRLGYAIVDEELQGLLDIVQEPFNVNRAALAAGRASLERLDLVEERRLEAVAGRELLSHRLAELGANVYPSEANFVLADMRTDDVELAQRLLERGILVRPGSEFGLHRHLRITVGAEPLMERVVEALAQALAPASVPTSLDGRIGARHAR